MLYVFKRKKDQPEGEKDNHQSVRTIKTYCVDDISYLDMRYDEIKQLCEVFKARAYIHIQKQNHKDVAMNMITEIVNRIQSLQSRNSLHRQRARSQRARRQRASQAREAKQSTIRWRDKLL